MVKIPFDHRPHSQLYSRGRHEAKTTAPEDNRSTAPAWQVWTIIRTLTSRRGRPPSVLRKSVAVNPRVIFTVIVRLKRPLGIESAVPGQEHCHHVAGLDA